METVILFEEVQGMPGKSFQDFFKILSILFSAAFVFNLWKTRGELNNVSLALLTIAAVSALVAIFNNTRLITQIRNDGIYVRFPPLQSSFARYPWHSIEKIFTREFNALAEYNGWGLKTGIMGRGYIVFGNIGIQIVLKDGSLILISTRRSENVERILEELKVK